MGWILVALVIAGVVLIGWKVERGLTWAQVWGMIKR